jgi:peroxiredoxin
MMETYEIGPSLNLNAPDFTLLNYDRRSIRLSDIMGKKGVLLGFIGDIWSAASIRRIFWMQRHAPKFAAIGVATVLIVRDHPHTLQGFHLSSALPVPFPMLADPDGSVHRVYRLESHPGLVLLDHERVTRRKWLMPDERVWPTTHELVQMIGSLPE